VEQHGGFLHFEPHQPRGTVFIFTLPVASSDAQQSSVMADSTA
jgi:two-component system, LuxR family, sensor histidine kinase DctS